MILEVTAEDIKRGKRNNTFCCPIAQSLTRHGFKNVAVGYKDEKYIQVVYGDSFPVTRIFVPDIRDKIDAYDDGAELEPFSIDLGEVTVA